MHLGSGFFFPAKPVFVVLVHVKACWVLAALWAPGAVCCCPCVSLATGRDAGTSPCLRLGRKSHLNEWGGLEDCGVPFL